tara:strand:- start:116 stop:292 length:177 start_codon:yes stop_codon:yes gene_type:complete
MKPTTIRMDTPDSTTTDQKFLVNIKIMNIDNLPHRKIECSGQYDKKTISAILELLEVK